MSADFALMEGAIADWVQSATGLTAYWRDQNASQPEGDYVSLALDGPFPVGIDSTRYFSRVGAPAGEEVEVRIVGEREMHLLAQAFTVDTLGPLAAARVLGKLQLALRLPSTQLAFRQAGLSIFDIGPIQNIATVLDADIQGRAAMRVRLYFRDSLSEFTTFIERVEGTFTEGESPPIPFTVSSDS